MKNGALWGCLDYLNMRFDVILLPGYFGNDFFLRLTYKSYTKTHIGETETCSWIVPLKQNNCFFYPFLLKNNYPCPSAGCCKNSPFIAQFAYLTIIDKVYIDRPKYYFCYIKTRCCKPGPINVHKCIRHMSTITCTL